MKQTVYRWIISSLIMVVSCVPNKNSDTENRLTTSKPKKIDQILLLPTDSVYALCDLSNDSISEFPDLSAYTIHKLDLSYNQIDLFIQEFLPKNLISINISHNKLDHLDISNANDKSKLQEIVASYNDIEYVCISDQIKRLNVSHNNIRTVMFNHNKITYLNISDNPNLSNEVDFFPSSIDTIIRNNIANEKPLVFKLEGIQ